MVEVTEIRTHTKANIKTTVIKAIITIVIKDSIIIHVEISLKEIVTINQGAEAVAMVEVITAVVVTVGPIIEAMLITNIISIMLMMMNAGFPLFRNHKIPGFFQDFSRNLTPFSRYIFALAANLQL